MKTSKLSRWLIPVLISIFTFILLLATEPDMGITWDEPAYIASSESYMSWFEKVFTPSAKAFSDQAITSAWQINSEHPPLDKIWSGTIWSIVRGFTEHPTAHRMGNMMLASIMFGILFSWIQGTYGYIAGFAAVAALLTMPRFFFHAHLSSLDVPAAFSVFITTFVFWKIKDYKKWTWGILLGVVWGLALATKINAIFLPFTLGLWWLIFSRKGKLALRLVLMGLVAIPVFLAVWPWLYVNTIERLFTYIGFVTTDHWQIGQFYLGQYYMPPPWHFGFVIVFAVIPLSLTILYFTGVLQNLNGKKDNGLTWLFFISALTPILAIAISRSLVYDNDRMYMAAFPFLAGLAGVGFAFLQSVWKRLVLRWKKPILLHIGTAVLALLVFAPQLVTMVRLYPHYLSYYGEGVGGLKGATRLGLETTYWCETYSLAFPMINAQAEYGDSIWADPWSHDVLIYYQMGGVLREDLVIITPDTTTSILGPNAPKPKVIPMNEADWFLFEHRQTTNGWEGHNNSVVRTLKNQNMVFEFSFDDVPVFSLYSKR